VRGVSVLTLVGVGLVAGVRKWDVSAMAMDCMVGEGVERMGGPVIDKQEVDRNAGLSLFS
jgi:hypothetical protein